MEIPSTGRATIIEDFNGTEIIIPSKKNIALTIFLGFWLCGWCAGEFFASKQVITEVVVVFLCWLGSADGRWAVSSHSELFGGI